jgi:NADH-quinone oxidoreductase subunit D
MPEAEMSFTLMFQIITFLQKEDYTSMESLIYHFKIVMGEVPVPGRNISSCRRWQRRIRFYLVTDEVELLSIKNKQTLVLFTTKRIQKWLKELCLGCYCTFTGVNVIAGELDAQDTVIKSMFVD